MNSPPNGLPPLPKGETVWVTYTDARQNCRFIMTSRPSRDAYVLYELADGAFKKLGRSQSPAELEEKYHVYARPRGTG